MIDPARGVAADAGIDHTAVVDLEENGVSGIVGIAVRQGEGFVPRRALALVSMIRVPLAISVEANTPRPWIDEWRTV
jgi:hypothetical protein